MKILYGVVGEGMGHATRSRVILNHLVKQHDLEIVVSGRAHQYLSKYFFNVTEIQGLRMTYEDNKVDRSATAWDFITRLPSMVNDNFQEFIRLGERFSPDVVISDFDSFAFTFGKHHEIPVISIDNMQIINRCKLDIEIPEKYLDDFKVAKTIVKSKLPGCYHYLITTFFFPPVRKDRTSLYPPILRDRILEAQPVSGEHLLVYQTSTTNQKLLEILKQVNLPCIVYGFNREEKEGNIWLRSFSEEAFVNDLATCQGVLASGGFSLMGEAVYLGKPMLAVPVRKQFEQILNALYLQKLEYGEFHEELSPHAVMKFVENLDSYSQNLKQHRQEKNQSILEKLDALLKEVAKR